MTNKWTKEEDDVLIENYIRYGLDSCIEKLNRTKRSIQERRKKLKL